MKKSRYDFHKLPPLLQRLHQRKKHIEESSRLQYIQVIAKLEKTLRNERGNFNLEELNRNDVMDYFDLILERGYSDGYVYNIGSKIRNFSEFLYEEDILDEKEFKKIKIYLKDIKPETGEFSAREPMSDEEITVVFIKVLNALYRMVFWTCLNYGLRPSEASKLILEDIMLDKERPVLRIRKSKRKKWRFIPITPSQKPVWESWFETRKNYGVVHDSVFFNASLRTLNSLSKMFNEISKITEMHIYPYKLRYTYAVKLWRHGVDILVISKMLGHTSIDTTMRYLRVREEEIREKYLEETKGLF